MTRPMTHTLSLVAFAFSTLTGGYDGRDDVTREGTETNKAFISFLSDPMGAGFVSSLAKTGQGTLDGASNPFPEHPGLLSIKRQSAKGLLMAETSLVRDGKTHTITKKTYLDVADLEKWTEAVAPTEAKEMLIITKKYTESG